MAWAITEHLSQLIGCRCLFATHYHELTELADSDNNIHNLTVAIAEQDDEVVFLHQIIPGAATKSYGIHVAQLAGVPSRILQRANEVLATLDHVQVQQQVQSPAAEEYENEKAEPAKPAKPDSPAASEHSNAQPQPQSKQRIAEPTSLDDGQQLSLFAPAAPSQTVKRLAECDVDHLTPRQALDLLYELQAAAQQEQ